MPLWPSEIFNPSWLATHGEQEISVRNVHSGEDRMIKMSDFIDISREMAEFAEAGEKERFYGKDAPCPKEWNNYLNAGEIPDRLLADGPSNLLNSLPRKQQVETLMCYLGGSDTYTPIHKDLCASSGHNLMCYTERDGSSLWMMTDSHSARPLTDHFLALNRVLDHETHIMSLEEAANAAANAKVTMYVVEQRLGDLVLVPPRSYHQVVNRGGLSIKTSWSRMTAKGLQTALYYELPLYRRVCRVETYRVKSTIYHSIRRLTTELQKDRGKTELAKLLVFLMRLFDHIIEGEYYPQHKELETIQRTGEAPIPELQCDFCGADIFQSFLYCNRCVQERTEAIEDSFILCPGCYVEGRSCKCGELIPAQKHRFGDLLEVRRGCQGAVKRCWERNENMRKVQWTPESKLLDTATRTGMFAACMILAENRRKLKPEAPLMRCSTQSGGDPHDIPPDWRVYCEKCHRSRCFWHQLNGFYMHSMQVLHASCLPTFHEKHITSKKSYEDKKASYAQQEIKGHMPDKHMQLSDLALVFTTCKPLHPMFTKPGWYDENLEIIRGVDGIPDHLKQGYYNPTSGSDDAATDEVQKPALTRRTKKRKAFVLDCVLITSKSPRPRTSKRSKTSVNAQSIRHSSKPGPSQKDVPQERPRKRFRILEDPTSCGPTFNSELAKAIDSSSRNSATPHGTGAASSRSRSKPEQKTSSASSNLNSDPPSTSDQQQRMRVPRFLGSPPTSNTPLPEPERNPASISSSILNILSEIPGPPDSPDIRDYMEEVAALREEIRDIPRQIALIMLAAQNRASNLSTSVPAPPDPGSSSQSTAGSSRRIDSRHSHQGDVGGSTLMRKSRQRRRDPSSDDDDLRPGPSSIRGRRQTRVLKPLRAMNGAKQLLNDRDVHPEPGTFSNQSRSDPMWVLGVANGHVQTDTTLTNFALKKVTVYQHHQLGAEVEPESRLQILNGPLDTWLCITITSSVNYNFRGTKLS
ncbi:hypothetical protein V5O48_000458 [Marasmius crinis-equi]|uniref:JmjC domain-containing protein n=1 Tax=Marasmius crinis-equi TaxID=585013 RepID=A0ABR3G153_9AGAR